MSVCVLAGLSLQRSNSLTLSAQLVIPQDGSGCGEYPLAIAAKRHCANVAGMPLHDELKRWYGRLSRAGHEPTEQDRQQHTAEELAGVVMMRRP